MFPHDNLIRQPKDEGSMISPEELQQAGAQPRPLHFKRLYSHVLQKGFGCQPLVGQFCLEYSLISLLVF